MKGVEVSSTSSSPQSESLCDDLHSVDSLVEDPDLSSMLSFQERSETPEKKSERELVISRGDERRRKSSSTRRKEGGRTHLSRYDSAVATKMR